MKLKPLQEAALEAEYAVIVEALKKTYFDKKEAANALQVTPRTIENKIELYKKMQELKEMAETPNY